MGSHSESRSSGAATPTRGLDGGHPTPPARELLAVFALVLAIYVVVTPRPHGFYHHHVYMAKAFLAGRVDLVDVPAYYHDLIYARGKVYAPFQPVPALLLMPLVAVRGPSLHPGRFGQIIAALAVAIFVGALGRLGRPRAVRLFSGMALGVGSVLWSATAIGSAWFLAHAVVTLALALLLWELAGQARGWVAGLWLASAFLTRLTLTPAIPAVALLLMLRRGTLRPLQGFAIATAGGLAAMGAYNYLRFGSPLESGIGLVSMALPSAQTVSRSGLFAWQYVAEHLYTIVFRAPELIGTWPFLKPDPAGMSLLFTSPVILRLLFGNGGLGGLWAWGLPAPFILGPILGYFSVGWVQFGYRYSLDWWPFVLVLLAFALDERPRAVDVSLLAASVLMNGLGVYWARVLGW
jgi:hypothetical protein